MCEVRTANRLKEKKLTEIAEFCAFFLEFTIIFLAPFYLTVCASDFHFHPTR